MKAWQAHGPMIETTKPIDTNYYRKDEVDELIAAKDEEIERLSTLLAMMTETTGGDD